MMPRASAFPALLQDFFQRRLIAERGASAHTIASYRDTFELLLRDAEERTGRLPTALTLTDLDAPLILGFLDYLETDRGNTPRTRNLRLTAIRSFMHHTSLRDPASLPVAQRVLAIPANALTDLSSASYRAKRSRPCSMHLTAPPGVVGAMPYCSPCSTTPARV